MKCIQYNVARELVTALRAKDNCLTSGDLEWYDKWEAKIDWICKQFLPSGSGIDCGTKLDEERSTERRLVFTCEYYHMNKNGMYDGWTSHTITVTPAFDGLDIIISGRDRYQIEEYLHEVHQSALEAICHEIDYSVNPVRNEMGYYFQEEWHPVTV
jgi:hypothetical protein